MGSLITTIVHGTAQILDAPQTHPGAVLASNAVTAPTWKSKATDQVLDTRTMADIGIEPGSLTWTN